ncbi:hypothetical protein [Streptococcus suis]|uniref:hypothetical protein n=1 Tax=Streptococcus suis TaxID=1307 RepID=UPI003570ED4E
MTYADGGIYTGEWQDGKRHGHGTMKWTNGNYYEGEWLEDDRHGHGKMFFVSGNTYDGYWENDKCHGQGKKVWTNGDIYEGEWKGGNRHGQGNMYYADGGKYEGSWYSDRCSGRDKNLWKDSQYEDDFKDLKAYDWYLFPGKGKYMWPNGDYYIGEWWYGEQHGFGILTKAGKTYSVVYREGQEVLREPYQKNSKINLKWRNRSS